MAVLNVNPTRMELTNLKRKLVTARRGHKLLKDKRDELMRQFLALVKENKALRIKVENALKSANLSMSLAGSNMSDEAIAVALMMPSQKTGVELGTKKIMSVDVPEFKPAFRTERDDGIFSYGYAFTSSDLDRAVNELNSILPDMLRLAEIEKSCQLLSAEIEKTRRRANALEHVMIPNYTDTIKYITMKLDEIDRSTTTRLMKVKDMMLDNAHNYV